MSVVFLDRNQKTIKFVNDDKIFENIQTKEITKNKDDLMYNVLNVTTLYDEELLNAYYFGVNESDSSFSLYRITNMNDSDNVMAFVGPHFASDELNGYTIKDIRPKNESIISVATRLLNGTEWRLGTVGSGLGNVTTNFYYVSLKEALKTLQTFGCEIVFKATVTGEGVTDKWIEIYRQIGTVSNKRFVYGDTALTVVREEERADIYTSIVGRGKGEEVGDGYGRRLEFSDIEWKKSNGDPLNKPKGQNWIEYPEMTALYGIPSKKGGMLKREKVSIYEDIEDPKELLKATYDELVECSRPLIQFKTTVLGADDLGNTVTIHHHEKNYHYSTRVYKVVNDRVNGTIQAELGDNITRSSAIKSAETQRNVENLQQEKMAFYDSTEISKWQSDIIRGAKGGAVIMMNPEDTGKGTSRQPYQTVWMNGNSLAESDHFLVANSEGIGFIEGEFNEANFKTAWTIDGTFNANYIRAGKIMAEIFETSFNGTGDTLKLVQGVLQIWNASNKIMELTKKGLEFWKGQTSLGHIGTTAQYPRWLSQDTTTTDRALYIGAEGADFISLVTDNKEGLFIPKASLKQFISMSSNTGIDLISGTNGVSIEPTKLLLNGDTFLNKQLTVTGNTFVNEHLTVEGNTFLKGATTVNGQFVADGNTFLNKQLTVAENVLMKSNLNVQRIDATSIYINGQKVVPGQGGGPGGGGGTGTGGYPSEVTSQADKFAWDLWAFLIANGYSKASAAGILGNVQGEVGASMNPDTGQINGPAYGWVQWDGSAYPLVGSPTWDGRAYVQRLIAKAGITYDYTTPDAQSRLIDWCMYNGQWIGQVYPTSVSGYKELTDPKTAANAFELNFERPAAAHPERQGYAQTWYDKFKDLQASQEYGEKGLERLNSLLGQWWGNGQCYAVPAEYSGYLGGCGLGAGTKYALTHVIGNTSAASDIGIAYDWNAVGWTVIQNPSYEDLVVGAICNWERNGKVDTWYADDVYGHTGVIRGLDNGRVQTYEQNTELGQKIVERDRVFYNSFSSIVIPPK